MYRLLYFFSLPEDRSISGLPVENQLGELSVKISLVGNRYCIRIDNFATSEDAEAFIYGIWLGLMHLMIDKGLAHESTLEIQKVYRPENPKLGAENLARSFGQEPKDDEVVDAFIDTSGPAIVKVSDKTRMLNPGSAKATHSSPGTIVLESLLDSFRSRQIDNPLSNENLSLALDIFRSHYSENSTRAKFLTLTMVLEVLAQRRERPQLAKKLLQNLQREIATLKETSTLSAEDEVSLDNLSRELDFRQKDSIRSAVRNLVNEVYRAKLPEEAENMATKAAELYDIRSKISHKGIINQSLLGQALVDLTSIVKYILKYRLDQIG